VSVSVLNASEPSTPTSLNEELENSTVGFGWPPGTLAIISPFQLSVSFANVIPSATK